MTCTLTCSKNSRISPLPYDLNLEVNDNLINSSNEIGAIGRCVYDLVIVKTIIESNSMLHEKFSVMLKSERVHDILAKLTRKVAEVQSIR